MSQEYIRLQPHQTETAINHNRMYEVAAANPYKGKKGGNCNVTQCQCWGASSWNDAMNAWYCEECATEIKKYSCGEFEVLVSPDYTYDYDAENSLYEATESLTKVIRRASQQMYGTEPYTRSSKIGRNEKCPCGSGNKFKKCCGR